MHLVAISLSNTTLVVHFCTTIPTCSLHFHEIIFILVYVVTVSFQLFTRLYTTFTGAHKDYEIWIVYALISPLRQLVFPLACLFTFFSLRKLSEFAPFKKCIHRRYGKSVADHDHQQKLSAKTVPDSTRVSAESSTFFIVPHPKSNIASYGSVLEEQSEV